MARNPDLWPGLPHGWAWECGLLALCLLLALNAWGSSSEPDGGPPLVRTELPTTTPEASDAISEQEVVGIYADGFSASWVSESPSDGTVCIIPEQAQGWCERHEVDRTDHLVRVRGLQPGTRYTYWLMSGGRRADTLQGNPEALTTLSLPPGRHLVDVVLLNDIHIGEVCSGQLVGLGDISIPACSAIPNGVQPGDYSSRMFLGAAHDIRALAPALVLVNGDLTNAGAYTDMVEARSLIEGLGIPWAVSRGNHDRAGQGGAGEAEFCGPTLDCYTTVFRPGSDARMQPVAAEVGNIRFLLLDSDNGGLGDLRDAGQQRWLAQQLADHPRNRTFILLHHPPSAYSNLTMFPPENGVPPAKGSGWLRDLIAQHPQVVGVFSGHTHRNLLGYDDATGRVPWVETGALKNYPAGYNVLRIYEGGYLREFHRADCDDGFCRRWASITRHENFGSSASYMLGELRARAFTYIDDCDQRTPAQPSMPWRVGGDSGQDTAGCGKRTDLFP